MATTHANGSEAESCGDCFEGWGVYVLTRLQAASPIYVFHRTADRWRYVGTAAGGMSCSLFILARVYMVQQWEYDLRAYPTGFEYCRTP